MEHVRCGITGCGAVTEAKGGPGFQKAEASSLVAVMRRDRAKAEDYARRHGVPRAYGDADELIRMEKPMAMTHGECVRMNDAFRAAADAASQQGSPAPARRGRWTACWTVTGGSRRQKHNTPRRREASASS